MAPRYDSSEQEFRDETEKPGSFWVLVAIGVVAFLGALLAINAGSPSECQSIRNSTARLHCFDAATQTQPAKGALIPGR